MSDLPLELLQRHNLARRLHDRGGELEVQFLYRDHERALPVWLDGRLTVVAWGNRRGESRLLPCTGWTWQSTVAAGYWAELGATPVIIPATMGLDKGVWYRVRQGVHGLAVRDEEGQLRVYVVCEPASHYYRIMTRSAWMPMLLEERI